MLLRFGVSNHLSLRDPQDLSLVASALQDDPAGLIPCSASPTGVLPAAVIYGANGSGKSNVISAFKFMRGAILHSHNRGDPNGGVPQEAFALDPEYSNKNSTFDADFVIEGTRFHYGFSCSQAEFVEEWLYAFPRNRQQVLFHRKNDGFRFGRSLKGKNVLLSQLVRPNSLFVSAAAQNGHEELARISAFFKSVRSDTSIEVEGVAASKRLRDSFDERIIPFLDDLGAGVNDFKWVETPWSSDQMSVHQALNKALSDIAGKGITIDLPTMRYEIQLAHRGKDNAKVFFDLEQESSGTRRLLVILNLAFHALEQGSLLLLDEIDASLHTKACETVLELFTSSKTNKKGAQLIATTHDTNLLRCRSLRRDQVWFTEKNREGATTLYPLSDIRTRKDDNLEKGYLQGRFGAIPFAGGAIASFGG